MPTGANLNWGASVSETPFIKFFPGDFLGGTSGLTAAERGAYITILCLIWENDGPVTIDEARLARRCGMPKATFKRVFEALVDEGKLIVTDAGITNERAEKTLIDRQNRTQNATHAANSRWGKEEQKTQQKQRPENAVAMREQCAPDAKPEARSQSIGGGDDTRAPEREKPPEHPSFRERILAACDVGPDGLIGATGRMIGRREEMVELQREMAEHGVSEADVLALVEEAMRAKNAGREPGPPSTLRFFLPSIRRFAAAQRAPVAQLPLPPPGQAQGGAQDRRRQEAEERERRIVDAAVHGTAKGFG